MKLLVLIVEMIAVEFVYITFPAIQSTLAVIRLWIGISKENLQQKYFKIVCICLLEYHSIIQSNNPFLINVICKKQNCLVDSKDGYLTSVLVFARRKGMYLLSAKTVKKKLKYRYSAPGILKFQRLTISSINSLPALIDLFHYTHKKLT